MIHHLRQWAEFTGDDMAVLDIPSNFKLTVGINIYDNLTLGLLEVEIITCKSLTLGQFYFTWLGFGHFTFRHFYFRHYDFRQFEN